MRTPKALYPAECIIYKPELTACPQCGGPLVMCDYLAWDKTVQTLDAILAVGSRPAVCADPACAGHTMRLLSAAGQQIAPHGSTYGYDVLARIGWLRQERRDAYGEIQTALAGRVQISPSHIRYLYQQVYLPLLACHERQHWDRLAAVARQHGGLIICYDIADLPRTNNGLESHFRDTQRRLRRTTGQEGQLRRTLQRLGAWELLPRPPTEPQCLAALRTIPQAQLTSEQQRLRRHQQRFRLQVRSLRRINVQFDKLRTQWRALPANSTG